MTPEFRPSPSHPAFIRAIHARHRLTRIVKSHPSSGVSAPPVKIVVPTSDTDRIPSQLEIEVYEPA